MYDTWTDEDVAAVARDASADPRSVVRRIAGLPVRGIAGDRIDRALRTFRLRRERENPARTEAEAATNRILAMRGQRR